MNRIAPPRMTRAGGWIVGQPRHSAPALRLFCLPYAAGAASVYTPWADRLPRGVEVCPVELPGRQTRWREDAFQRVAPLVQSLADALRGELDVPYALFGHSMGSLIAFELARELRRRGHDEPRLLAVSGGPAPSLRRERRIHDKPDDVVVDKLRELGGLPEEVCESPELLELLMPTIRADFAVCETYVRPPGQPLTCPVLAFAGTQDTEVPPSRVAPWEQETGGGFTQHLLPGGHFFLHTSRDAVLDTLGRALSAACHPHL
ncbi:thioesterase II family protein [Streptomyces xanthochromogenes]|uniref:thioesterase II family protein n=1 Tax=Streptomyces xanthochromogenes TaxID=67384 RepID=UPI003801758F